MKDEKDTKKELKELYSKMIQEHPELETMRVKTVLYSLGIMLIVVLGLFAYPKYATSNSMVLGGILSQFVLAFFLSYLLEKGVPYIDHFRKINHQYLPGMLAYLPDVNFKISEYPPAMAEVLNCGLFTKHKRHRSYVHAYHWLEGTYHGRHIRMCNIETKHSKGLFIKVNQAWRPSLLMLISYPEGPSTPMQVYPRYTVLHEGGKHSYIWSSLSKIIPNVGERVMLDFPDLNEKIKVFTPDSRSSPWLKDRSNLDRLIAFQTRATNRLCFMALGGGQLAVLVFNEEIFSVFLSPSLKNRRSDLFNLYYRSLTNILKLVDELNDPALTIKS